MGYTHYWQLSPGSVADFARRWPQLVADAQKIAEAAAARGIVLCGPMGVGEPVFDIEKGIRLNGSDELNTSCESFVIGTPSDMAESDFCKTNREPYDLVVAAILDRARHLCSPAFTIKSDDGEAGFDDGHMLNIELFTVDDTLS